ncbi:MAG: hypothetical protein ABIS36_00845 [Chryseolinea sp.]
MSRLFLRKRLVIIGILLITLFIGVEITLRVVWGFANTVLFDEDKDIEYIAQPNQDRFRFGHRIIYNEYSMRSEPLRDSDKCRVLGFGDSVINGGSLTDQDSLATTIVEKDFDNKLRFLNISAGSWGPDNCAGYLKKYGSFNSKMIVLFVSSHDAHDNITFEPVVGKNESYPNHQYPLATEELLIRYIMPRIISKFGGSNQATDNLMINKNGAGFNTGFDYFRDYAIKNSIPLLICLHAEQQEVKDKKFNNQGEEIIDYCTRNGIRLVNGLDIGESLEDFRDEIHINERGQKKWSKVLAEEIRARIKECI